MAKDWDEKTPQNTEGADKSESSADTTDFAAEYRKLKSQYDGLQGHVKVVTTERDQLKSQLTSTTQDYEGKITELSTKYESVSKDYTTTAQQKQELEQKVAKFEQRAATILRVKAVAEEVKNPTLVALYEADLITGIETLDDEALKAKLVSAAKIIGNAQQGAVDDAFKGSTPPPPGDTQQPSATIEQLKKSMQTAMQTKGVRSQEYQDAYRLFQEAMLSTTK